MALMSSNEPMKLQCIYLWLMKNLPYYEEILAKLLTTTNLAWHDSPDPVFEEAKGLQDDVSSELERFDFPIDVTDPPLPEQGRRRPIKLFSISATNARTVLVGALKSLVFTREGTFNWFELPPELRVTIMEMAFAFPKSALECQKTGPVRSELYVGFRTLTRCHKVEFSFADWDAAHKQGGRFVETPDMKDILKLLCVSRQFFDEGVPTFYQINHFTLPSVEDLCLFIESVSESRHQYIAHISTTYRSTDYDIAEHAFDLLSTMKGLRKLEIRLPWTHWRWLESQYADEKYKNVMNVPGLNVLRAVKIRSVDFHNTCPRKIERWLKAGMLLSEAEIEEKARRCKAEGHAESTKQVVKVET